MLSNEVRNHLWGRLVPFWEGLRDRENGGFYGWMDSGLTVDREADKGCILNSRILWFFSNAAICLAGEEGERAALSGGAALPGAGGQPARQGEQAQSPQREQDRAEVLKECADWAYRFLRDRCVDAERGGVYWSLDYRGRPEDTTKHTYNQAFAVYALSSYYRAYRDREALELAERLIGVIEGRCFDAQGYKEALDIDFCPIANDKLSENGVMADRTMNTLLHVLEAYTEYLAACREAEQVSGVLSRTAGEGRSLAEGRKRREAGTLEDAEHGEERSLAEDRKRREVGALEDAEYGEEQVRERCQAKPTDAAAMGAAKGAGCGRSLEPGSPGAWRRTVEEKLRWILNLVAERVYNPELRRQEVFFDLHMESLIDLHSYGHDIEAAWLIDRCLEVLGDEGLARRMSPILRSLEAEVYEKAYARHSLANECERGVVDEKRVWWVQAEGVVGFYNAYQKTGERRYLEAAEDIWGFVRAHLVDERPEGEWFWYTDIEGNPALEKPIVEPWKCPYHNGRMCMEIVRRSAG